MGGSGDNRLLKILHIDPEINWGGGEAQVFSLLKQLAERGHKNDLLAHPHGQLFQRTQSLAVRAFPFVMRNDLDVRAVPALRRRIRRGDYDIVHFHTKRAHALALWLPRGETRPKYVVTRRMDYAEPRTWYTRVLYNRRVDGVVAISHSIVDVLIEAGVERGRIRCIPSGIDFQKFSAIEARDFGSRGVPVIGSLAVLEERKGLGYLLKAAARLNTQGVRLDYRIAGDGPLRRQLEEDARRLGLAQQVKFLGFLQDTVSFLAAIDIFAMPSLNEGLGVAALEAMAAGKPVVASRAGGLRESVVDGVTGILVPPRNESALAAAIAKLAGAPEWARSLGAQGRRRAREAYSTEHMARENEIYYRELLG